MNAPLAIDLCCGLGGWTSGLLAEGWNVIGFDIEAHDYGDGKRYPAQLVLQDVLTIHGRQFKDAQLIVCSPPCQEFSYMAMPWSRAKAIAAEYRTGKRDVKKLTALFDACFRIQREAIEAAGHHIPMVVENVRGAQPWVGRARWNFGSYYLWGDVPALMPVTSKRLANKIESPHLWLRDPARAGGQYAPNYTKGDGFKTQGMNWSDRTKHGQDFTRIAGQQADGTKVASEEGRRTDVGKGARFTSRDCGVEGLKRPGINLSEEGFNCTMARELAPTLKRGAVKLSTEDRRQHLSSARKAASALIAKIPEPLARWIARVYHPCYANGNKQQDSNGSHCAPVALQSIGT